MKKKYLKYYLHNDKEKGLGKPWNLLFKFKQFWLLTIVDHVFLLSQGIALILWILHWKENQDGYEKNFRLRDKNHASFKLNGQSRTAFGLLKAPELQRLSVTVEVLRIWAMIVGVMTVGVMTLSQY